MVRLDHIAFIIQFASCFFMTGVIVVIQLTHYPAFAQIDKTQFLQFHARHANSLGIIAGPAMTAELLSGFWLGKNGDLLFLLNAFAILVLWAITFFVSVPSHNRLSKGFEERAWLRLLRANWARTIIWFCRSVGFIYFLISM